jgi:hypothetical protein
MDLELFVTPGLGDASYLLASGREAVLVDPQRDAWRFIATAEERGWRIRHVIETHVHNDYLSGALETQAATGAEIAAPARGGYTFQHRPMDEGDELELGALRLTAMATPGHTPEYLAWAVTEVGVTADPAAPDAPLAVFTGGSLIVGSAGRTDLLGRRSRSRSQRTSSGPSSGSPRCRTAPRSCRLTAPAASAAPGRRARAGSRRSARNGLRTRRSRSPRLHRMSFAHRPSATWGDIPRTTHTWPGSTAEGRGSWVG